MGGKIDDSKRSEVLKTYLQGVGRDETASETGVSTGTVSSVERDFVGCAKSKGLDYTAEKYGVVESVDNLRSIATYLRKNGFRVEELREKIGKLEEATRIVPIDKLGELVNAIESLKDKSHVEAALKLSSIERRTRKTHEEVLQGLEKAEAKTNELTVQLPFLQEHLEKVKNETQKAEQELSSKKACQEAELQKLLKQHELDMQQVEDAAKTIPILKTYGIIPAQLNRLRNMLCSFEVLGFDVRKILGLIEKGESLQNQVETSEKKLAETNRSVEESNMKLTVAKKRNRRLILMVKQGRALKQNGWAPEIFDSVIRLAKAAGNPEEVLQRLELFTSSEQARMELHDARALTEKLKNETVEKLIQVSELLTRLSTEASELVEKKLPAVGAEAGTIIKQQMVNLANEYNSLAKKIPELVVHRDRLIQECLRYKKTLDEEIAWNTLLGQPENLSDEWMNHIFFEVLMPQIQQWSSGKTSEARFKVAYKIVDTVVSLAVNPVSENFAAEFFNAPEKATRKNAIIAFTGFLDITHSFCESLYKWCHSHMTDENASEMSKALRRFQDFCLVTSAYFQIKASMPP